MKTESLFTDGKTEAELKQQKVNDYSWATKSRFFPPQCSQFCSLLKMLHNVQISVTILFFKYLNAQVKHKKEKNGKAKFPGEETLNPNGICYSL